jgi:hypothetical protein
MRSSLFQPSLPFSDELQPVFLVQPGRHVLNPVIKNDCFHTAIKHRSGTSHIIIYILVRIPGFNMASVSVSDINKIGFPAFPEIHTSLKFLG